MTLLHSVTPPTPVKTELSLRPTRVATFLIDEGDWMSAAHRMMENYSRVWGGRGNLLIPVDENGRWHDVFWRILAAFDPDRLASYLPSARSIQLRDPWKFERSLDEKTARRLASGLQGTPNVTGALLDDPLTDDWQPQKDDSLRIRRRFGSFVEAQNVVTTAFTADCDAPHMLVDVLDLDPLPPTTRMAETSGLPPELRLVVASRMGGMAPRQVIDRVERGIAVQNFEIEEEHLQLVLEFCWANRLPKYLRARLGERAQTGWRPPYLVDAAFDLSPLGQTEVGLGTFRRISAAWVDTPVTVVVGDSPDDFALALALDRMISTTLWLPWDLFGAPAWHDFLLDGLLSSLVVASERRGTHNAEIQVTSTSLADRDLEGVRSELGGSRIGSRLNISVVDPEAICLHPLQRLRDEVRFSEARFEQFVGTEMATEFPPLVPSGVEPRERAWDCTWMVDVAIVDPPHALPARSGLSEGLTVRGRFPDADARSGTDGVAFFSHQLGVVVGNTLDQVLARPRIRRPDAPEVIEILLNEAGYRSEPSSAGNFTSATIGLWGGLDNLVEDLRDPRMSDLLHRFLSSVASGESPGVYLDTVNRRYLSLDDMSLAAHITRIDTRARVDRLSEMGVLARGLILQCQRCRYAGWYRPPQVDRTFDCNRCGHPNPVTAATWKNDPAEGPPWHYALEEVAYQALANNAAVPLLALGTLKENASSFLYACDRNVYRSDGQLCREVDFWAIPDGRLLIGEAKLSDHLSTRKTLKDERRKAGSLFEVAEAATADAVVLATSSSEWSDQTRRAVEEIAANWSDIAVEWVTGLGGTNE